MVEHDKSTVSAAASPPMIPPMNRPVRRRWRRLLDRFRRAKDGVTAVEFAIIAMPFFIAFFAIVELAIFFFSSRYLEDAVFQAGRQIMTGQVQGQANAETAFKNALAANLPAWLDPAKVQYDVRVVNQFSDVNLTPPMTNGALDPAKMGFQPGNSGQIVIVRAFYEYPMLGGSLGKGVPKLANGKSLITATTAFRNE